MNVPIEVLDRVRSELRDINRRVGPYPKTDRVQRRHWLQKRATFVQELTKEDRGIIVMVDLEAFEQTGSPFIEQ